MSACSLVHTWPSFRYNLGWRKGWGISLEPVALAHWSHSWRSCPHHVPKAPPPNTTPAEGYEVMRHLEDTEHSEHGTHYSAGQQPRVGYARCFYSGKSFLAHLGSTVGSLCVSTFWSQPAVSRRALLGSIWSLSHQQASLVMVAWPWQGSKRD